MDEFVDIIGYEGLYKINKNGDVYGVKNKKILKLFLNRKDYYVVSLWKNSKGKTLKIHRLIALHFIPNDDETKTQVDHIDGITTNNNIENLRWVTLIENARNVLRNNIYEFIRKESGTITYAGQYTIYINNKYIRKQKTSIYRNVVEKWVEQMKKEYPNEYIAGRI
jgi:hypothetical protein